MLGKHRRYTAKIRFYYCGSTLEGLVCGLLWENAFILTYMQSPVCILSIPSAPALCGDGARQRAWLAAWQQQQRVCRPEGGGSSRSESGVLLLVLEGGTKTSVETTPLQLWAYVSLGRNAFAPSLNPPPLLVPQLSPLHLHLIDFWKHSLPSFSLFFSMKTPSVLSHVILPNSGDLDRERCVVFRQPTDIWDDWKGKKGSKDNLSHTHTHHIRSGLKWPRRDMCVCVFPWANLLMSCGKMHANAHTVQCDSFSISRLPVNTRL